MVVVERAWRPYALLAMAQRTFDRDLQGDVGWPSILDREGVDGAGHIGIAPVRRKQGSAYHEGTDGASERGQPAHGSLPGDAFGREHSDFSINTQHRAHERGTLPGHEVRRPGELDGRPRPTMQHAERVNRAVGRVDARQGQPVVTGELPRDRRKMHSTLLSDGTRGFVDAPSDTG